MRHEELEHAVLGGAERHVRSPAVTRWLARSSVRPPISRSLLARVPPPPAQHGVDAGQQLARRKRLGDVVVRAAVEPRHLVALGGARREHDDGQLARVAASRLMRRVSSRPLMSGSIQSTSIRSGRWSASCTRALLAVLGLAHVEAGALQCERDHLADGLFIFDDQYLAQFGQLLSDGLPSGAQIS